MQHAGRAAASVGTSTHAATQAAIERRSDIARKIPADPRVGQARHGTIAVMPGSWTLSAPYFLVFSFLCGLVGFRMGWRLRSRALLPAMQGALGWVAYLASSWFLGAGWAAAAVGAWALGTSAAGVFVFFRSPEETDARVLRAKTYRETMLAWLESGRSQEPHPFQTVSRHGRELIWYTAASVLTANLGGI